MKNRGLGGASRCLGIPATKTCNISVWDPKGGFHFPGLSSFPPPASFFINFCGICLWIDSQDGVVVALWCWGLPGGITCVSPPVFTSICSLCPYNCASQWIKQETWSSGNFFLILPHVFFFFLGWSYQTPFPWLFSGGGNTLAVYDKPS